MPGFKDRANLNGEVRRDAPTGVRLSQHLLLSIIGGKDLAWKFLTADAKSGTAVSLRSAKESSASLTHPENGGFACHAPLRVKVGHVILLIKLACCFGMLLGDVSSKGW